MIVILLIKHCWYFLAAAIVGGSVGRVVLCLTAGAVYQRKRQRRKQQGKKARVHNNRGEDGSMHGDQEAGNDSVDISCAGVGPGANYPRKGGNIGNEQGILEYALVDKTKKKKKDHIIDEPQAQYDFGMISG